MAIYRHNLFQNLLISSFIDFFLCCKKKTYFELFCLILCVPSHPKWKHQNGIWNCLKVEEYFKGSWSGYRTKKEYKVKLDFWNLNLQFHQTHDQHTALRTQSIKNANKSRLSLTRFYFHLDELCVKKCKLNYSTSVLPLHHFWRRLSRSLLEKSRSTTEFFLLWPTYCSTLDRELYFLEGSSEMEQQEFISRVGEKIKVEDTVTQILPHNLIQHTAWTPCQKLGTSAKARVHH